MKITSESRYKLILDLFRDKSGYLRLVIASVAFGMGVNCPDVRKVIHFRAPASLTSYVHESGRSGRDWECFKCNSLIKNLVFEK